MTVAPAFDLICSMDDNDEGVDDDFDEKEVARRIHSILLIAKALFQFLDAWQVIINGVKPEVSQSFANFLQIEGVRFNVLLSNRAITKSSLSSFSSWFCSLLSSPPLCSSSFVFEVVGPELQAKCKAFLPLRVLSWIMRIVSLSRSQIPDPRSQIPDPRSQIPDNDIGSKKRYFSHKIWLACQVKIQY